MRNATHTVLIGLIAAMSLSATPAAVANDQIPVSRMLHEMNMVSHRPAVSHLEIISASAQQRRQVGAAVALFENAGLELPPLVIQFSDNPDVCEGNLGTHRPQPGNEPAVISVCTNLRITLIHELAHAWDHHELSDARRQAFLEHWGLDNWNDKSADWHDRGTERAAETIAHTLILSEPTDNPDILDYVCGFGILTGRELPEVGKDSCVGAMDNGRERFEASFEYERIPESRLHFEQGISEPTPEEIEMAQQIINAVLGEEETPATAAA